MKICICLAVFIAAMAAPAHAREMARIADVVIVKSDAAGQQPVERWRYGDAAYELGDYLSQMSGKTVPVVSSNSDSGAGCIVAVGGPDVNPLTRKLTSSGVINLDIPAGSDDGFAMRSATANGKCYLVLAGQNGLSTLYAIYDYLERFCNVGFFMDGEYVPRTSTVPFIGVSFSSKPRFEWRQFTASCCGQYGLRKYHYLFKTRQDWERYFGWLTKRKVNMVHWGMGYGTNFGGTADLSTYGLTSMAPTEGLSPAGWPVGWTYPHNYFTDMSRNIMRYGRNRGIKFIYYFGSARVPPEVIAAHPEYKYADQWGEKYLHPDEPMYDEYARRAYRAVIDLFGTDHLYMEDPYSETRGGASTAEESFRMKTLAAVKSIRIMKEIDRQAVWVTSNWDQIVQSNDVWVPERYKEYLSNFKPEDMLIYECASDFTDRFYAKYGYYCGKNWTLGILHSFQGDDQLHGNIEGIIRKTKEAVDDPGSKNLRGFFNIPETVGHNIMVWQLTTALAWDPTNVSSGLFIKDYCVRRYGRDSAGRMQQAIKALVKAVYSSNDNYQMAYKRFGWEDQASNCPLVDDFAGNSKEYLEKESKVISNLKKSLDLALSERKTQDGNQLYENDLVDITKCYWGHRSNIYFKQAYQAFSTGNATEFEKNLSLGLKMLDKIQKLLSTRKDYYLQEQISEVEAYPGSNPYSVMMIKQACINDQYPCNDVCELFPHYYVPRARIWGDVLREKLVKGDKTVTSSEVNPRFRKIDEDWLNKPILAPEEAKFKGSPIDAILTLSSVSSY
ncbi:MAG: alpha-N-acetylglucosaminidase C-terminal domain-containing protein [Armatimonadetes bacterium]|nr:alpha-N-acetylglucosaminidase C-terminal domain-containing protein [Armatimonadota bacterium]